MFNSISFYIILTLSGLLSISAYLNVSQINTIASLKVAQDSYVKALESSQKQLETKGESCKIDDGSVVELTAEKAEVREKIDTLVDKIKSLPKKGTPITTEANNNVQSNTVYGPEPIDLSLRVLLDQAYCLASPDDSSVCGTTR